MSFLGYQIFYCALWILSFGFIPFSKKLRLGLLGRKGLNQRLEKGKGAWLKQGLNPRPYWFHFSSAGELEQAIPIAEEIKRRDSKASILFTFFSPSGEKGIKLETARREKAQRPLPWDTADYLPLDLSWKVAKALNIVDPKALILINRELWPALLHEAYRRAIPIYLFSSFFPSYRTKMLKVWLPYLKLLKCIGTVGESSTQILLKTESTLKVNSIGDTRIERVLERKKLQLAPPAWGTFLTAKSLFVGASLWEEDFEALKPTLIKLTKEFPQWRICLVPHEPEESMILKIKNWGKENGITFRRFSHFLKTPDEVSPLIMDSLGLLAELYRFSALAFVGGSFKARVHNVLEPAAYGNAIVTGPFIENSFEATEMNRLGLGLESVNDSQFLLKAILNRISDVSFTRSEGQKAHQYLLDRQGASRRYCDLLTQRYGFTFGGYHPTVLPKKE